jgi:peptidyl-prolyl cis-trans isomerase C
MKSSIALTLAICSALLVSPLVSAKGNNDVLASRGDIVVTKEDVERYIAYRIPEDKRAAIYASEKDLRQIMENIFVVRLLATQAENPDSPQLQWQANYQLETSLAELAQAQQVAKAMAGIDWDVLARESYAAEPDKYKTAPSAEASHILISKKGRSKKEAADLIMQLRERVMAGEDFEALALEYSDDPTAKENKGYLGTFGPGKMVKAFSDVVFSMKEPGSISGPVESGFGYHLIKLHKMTPGTLRDFDSVKERIMTSLRAEKAAKIRDQLLVEARSVDGVTLNEQLLKKMVKN